MRRINGAGEGPWLRAAKLFGNPMKILIVSCCSSCSCCPASNDVVLSSPLGKEGVSCGGKRELWAAGLLRGQGLSP